MTHHFTHVPVARGLRRLTGLIGRRDLHLFIPRCASVHTWFMSTAIDVVFLDSRQTIVAIRERMGPWRMAFGLRGTSSALELPAGSARERGLAIGDAVSLSL